jgi:hypothetical protein
MPEITARTGEATAAAEIREAKEILRQTITPPVTHICRLAITSLWLWHCCNLRGCPYSFVFDRGLDPG